MPYCAGTPTSVPDAATCFAAGGVETAREKSGLLA